MRVPPLAPLAIALLLVGPALGNHSQPLPGGGTIVFDHKPGGNEWWVEVIVQSSSPVSSVEVMDDGGPWMAMTHKPEWGSWARSFHVEPGHRVTFRATTAAGVVTSCPFTHPAGNEQCGTPPSAWSARTMATFPPNTDSRGLVVGDGDGDGRSEAYATNLEGLYRITWTSSGWTSARIASGPYQEVIVGRIGDNDVAHVFATTHTEVHMFTFDGDGWFDAHLFTAPEGISAMALGDVNDDGEDELWVASPLDGGRFWVYDWASGPTPRGIQQYGIGELAIGDGDNDGDNELFMAQSSRGQNAILSFDQVSATQFSTETVAASNGAGSQGLAVADVDRNGRNEVYAVRGSVLEAHARSGGFWGTAHTIALGGTAAGSSSMAIADVDNDQRVEVYVERGDAHLVKVSWTTTWIVSDQGAFAPIVQPLVAGDADNDGRMELHGMTFSVGSTQGPKVLQLSDHAAAPRPPAPPTPWEVSFVDGPARSHGKTDLAIGDGNRDGRNELYVPLRAGLFQERWTGTGWAASQISTEPFDRVAVGDADRDGRPEVYAGGPLSVTRFSWSGTAWTSRVLIDTSGLQGTVGGMSLGDVDGDGKSELYVAFYDDFGGGGTQPVWQVAPDGSGGWTVTTIAQIPGGAYSVWVGDGLGSGRQLWLVGDALWYVDHTGSGWTAVFVDEPEGTDVGYLTGVVTGDIDRNGVPEVYVSVQGSPGKVVRYARTGGTWSSSDLWRFPGTTGPNDLFAADADGAAGQELYATTEAGHLLTLRWTGTTWVTGDLGDVPDNQDAGDLVLGDGDGDGRIEAYVSAFRFDSCCPTHNLYRFSPTGSPPPPGFDATFTGVTGNEWWIQTFVSATGGTLTKVEVRLNGGSWLNLPKQSWGGWAASYRAVQGTIVQFRATSTAGATDLSGCYQWIPPSGQNAASVPCGPAPPPPPPPAPPPPPPPPPGGFDATFSQVRGNEWWAEAVITANAPIHAVFLTINCQGEPADMSYNSNWGKWVLGNTRIPSGSKVTLTAIGDGGSEDSGGYIWPNATPTTGC